MVRKSIVTGLNLLLVCSLFLAACSSQSPTNAPAVNEKAIYTQAAQTVEAGRRMTEEKRPSPTPSATLAPTNTAPALPSLTPTTDAGVATATVTPAVNAVPSATAAGAGDAAANSSADNCLLVEQSPSDGTKIAKNASWDMRYVIKNTGTTTWNTKYALKFFSGERLNSPSDFYIQKEVKPNETYTFLFTLKAPDSTGKKTANWVIQNPEGKNFCWFFLEIEVN